jgi:hypothetical protein
VVRLVRFIPFLVIVLLSCKKKAEPVQSPVSVIGLVCHQFTGAGIAGVPIFVEVKKSPSGTRMYTVVSDSKGQIKLDAGPNAVYRLEHRVSTPFDTTANNWRYMTADLTFSENSPQPLPVPLLPSGWFRAYILNSDWSQVPADSVEVVTIYEKKMLNPLVSGKDFNVDPGQVHKINLILFKNGIPGDTVERSVYIPNYYHGPSNYKIFFYPLSFN